MKLMTWVAERLKSPEQREAEEATRLLVAATRRLEARIDQLEGAVVCGAPCQMSIPHAVAKEVQVAAAAVEKASKKRPTRRFVLRLGA